MARKKQPTIVDIVDDLVNASSPVSNGHDAERMAIAEESGELEEMMEPLAPAPRRTRGSKAQSRGGSEPALGRSEGSPTLEEPVKSRRKRAPRNGEEDEGDEDGERRADHPSL